ncbi:hypothetical protein GOP47_0001318 [Adiantum capillus-veneris]|uniref:Phytocyanin domain-containing protein n=1 Tax=Adiantum capillus-veneris TaxID=13818 RepID=A0A9D4V8U3_ADICA|nr:hypothetical protein GOP47_0001318 [Adiantum capillus-veneris]
MKSFFLHSRESMALVLAFMVAMLSFKMVSAIQYTVGDSVGWGLGNDLQSWSTQFKFSVGDELYFPYPAGQHSVLLVTEEDYKGCNIKKPITSDNGMGNMVITLISAETYYFICGVPGHCEQGLRLSIAVEHEAPSTSDTTSPPKEVDNDSPKVLTPPLDSHLDDPTLNSGNNFRRNSSSKLYFSTPVCIALMILSISCTLRLV